MTIEETTRKHQELLLSLPNVSGVGIGEMNGKPVILVFVRRKLPESVLRSSEVIPRRLEGYATDVRLEIKVGSSSDAHIPNSRS
jgi:hypothetical protein